ncbi:MAG: hypothetical protein RQ826_00520 [Xanthomonadales bacterium]|nr:hypothetical protein [Xanthomonadales bacterium]
MMPGITRRPRVRAFSSRCTRISAKCSGWFTYEVERPSEDVSAILGDASHRWLTATGTFSGGQAELEIDFTSGGVFDQSEPKPVHEPGGSILLQFESCLAGSVIYDIPSIGLSGFIPIERISLDSVARSQLLNDAN